MFYTVESVLNIVLPVFVLIITVSFLLRTILPKVLLHSINGNRELQVNQFAIKVE